MLMFACRDITELVTDYVEKRMGFLDRLKFQMHVGMCWACRRYVAQVRTTIEAAGKLPVEPPPPEVLDEMRKRFRNWKQGPSSPGSPPSL